MEQQIIFYLKWKTIMKILIKFCKKHKNLDMLNQVIPS